MTAWTDNQLKALDFEGNMCVLAGAGSGKTMTLVELVLRLLDGSVPGLESLDLSQILALTYTEKAAREMRDRIRSGLNKKIREAAASDRRAYWIRQRRFLDRSQITTIHSFCLQFLRQYGLELGLDPGFGIMEQERDFEADTRREILLDWIQDEKPALLDLLDYFPWMSRGRGAGVDRLLTALSAHARTYGRSVNPGSPESDRAGNHLDTLRRAADLVEELDAAAN